MNSNDLLGCFLSIPDIGRIRSIFYFEQPELYGFEYIPNYYPDSKSCTFRVYPEILQELGKKNGQ